MLRNEETGKASATHRKRAHSQFEIATLLRGVFVFRAMFRRAVSQTVDSCAGALRYPEYREPESPCGFLVQFVRATMNSLREQREARLTEPWHPVVNSSESHLESPLARRLLGLEGVKISGASVNLHAAGQDPVMGRPSLESLTRLWSEIPVFFQFPLSNLALILQGCLLRDYNSRTLAVLVFFNCRRGCSGRNETSPTDHGT